jgi:DNA-binding IclR family transcriptional regulator
MKVNKSTLKTADVLNLVASSESPMTITKISNALDMPKSSTYEIVYALVEKGYLEIDNEESKTFKLGIKMFEVGVSFLKDTDLHHESRPILDELMLKSGETVFLAVEDRGSLVYLDKVEGYSAVRTTAKLGSRNPMHCTGLGKALLASYSNEKVKEITDLKGMNPKTEYSIKTYEELISDLDAIRKRGFSIDDKESEVEVYCVAAPIYDSYKKSIAAISIASITQKMHDEKLKQLSELVTNAALAISKRLGFTEERLYFNFQK